MHLVNKKIVNPNIQSFQTGMLMLFTVFYCLNMLSNGCQSDRVYSEVNIRINVCHYKNITTMHLSSYLITTGKYLIDWNYFQVFFDINPEKGSKSSKKKLSFTRKVLGLANLIKDYEQLSSLTYDNYAQFENFSVHVPIFIAWLLMLC